MSWSINDNWLRASEQKGVRVIGLVTIELQKNTALYLQNYADLVGSGTEILLNIDGVFYSAFEGTDWTAATSNLVTAQNIGAAMVSIIEATDLWHVRYIAEANATGANLTFILGEAAYASSSILFNADFAGEPANTLTDLDNGPESIKLCKSQEPFVGSSDIYSNLIQDIRGLEMSVDPLTREISLSSPEMDVSDVGIEGGLRWAMRRFMLYGKAVDLRIGFDGLDESDFEAWPRLYIQKVTPKPGAGITLQLGDGLYDLTSSKIQGEWVGMHPLELVQDHLDSCVLPDRYDATSLDPTNSDYDSIGHWNCSRYNDSNEESQLMNGINDPTPALDVLNSVLVMLNGTLRLDQDGVYRFKLLDEDAPAVRSFEHLSELSQVSYPCKITSWSDAYDGLTNAATINFAQSRVASSGQSTYRELDDASVRECLRLVETTLDLEWCNSVANLFAAYMTPGTTTTQRFFADPDTTQFVIQYAPRQGFCGTRQLWQPGTSSFVPYSNSELSASVRVAFIRLEGKAYDTAGGFSFTGDPEIIAVDLCDMFPMSGTAPPGHPTVQLLDSELVNRSKPGTSYADSGIVGGVLPTTVYDPLAYTWLEARYVVAGTYNTYGFTLGRGGLGTTEAAARDGGISVDEDGNTFYEPIRAVDITIPVDIAKRWLRRTRFGMPKNNIEVGARHYDLELSDVVQLIDDTYLAHQQPELGTSGNSSVFEITRKRCRLFEADPCMEFEVSFLRSDIYPATSVTPVYDPTVTVGVAVEPDFVVTENGEMVTNDQDADGISESYTLKA